eukprot:GGOE01045307.1.p1 GENE.GGOE01045307.1~~GGOE01045307.1.p1  ORF type:complete len:454 (-),score=122.70 GGOE01045307.1:439-1800(-)
MCHGPHRQYRLHHWFVYPALVLLTLATILSIIACALPQWVVHNTISDTILQNHNLTRLQGALTNAYLDTLSLYSAAHPGAVKADQSFGIWEACTNVAGLTNTTISTVGCTSLYYGYLPACELGMEAGLVAAQAFVVLGIITCGFASCCCALVLYIPRGKLCSSSFAFAASLFLTVAFLTYYGTAKTIFCGQYQTRLLCEPGCAWGASFWLCLTAFLFAFLAGLVLCIVPVDRHEKQPPTGVLADEGERAMPHENTLLNMLEDEEMCCRPTDRGHSLGRFWVQREEEDEWARLMRNRLRELPSPNLGVELHLLDDQAVTASVFVVHKVIPGGPASKAGLLAGDIINLINGDHVDGMDKFRVALEECKNRGIVILDIFRALPEGEEGAMRSLEVKVTLHRPPGVDADSDDETSPHEPQALGTGEDPDDCNSQCSDWLLAEQGGFVPPLNSPVPPG